MTSGRRGAGRVEFHRVWKQFRYGEVHDSLRDLLPALGRRAVTRVLGRGGETAGAAGAARPAERGGREFWATRDVSFSVGPGEALGLIGANGAGKSTLLKLLTRVLEPTHGQVRVEGRVGALLEMTAGFHPDLTGRENVFLQGAIMGMRQREIAAKFDQIVAFADLPRFIDTPVKRYSSGMSARLGFSIAAHLDPDVLVIDEALAVGDAAFQRRAFARIRELVQREIPVIVVSHQLDQVTTLCTHAVVLERGRVVHQGPPGECVAAYLARTFTPTASAGSGAAIEVAELTCVQGASVPSGGRLTVNARCVVWDAARADQETFAVRVRAGADGAVLTYHRSGAPGRRPAGRGVVLRGRDAAAQRPAGTVPDRGVRLESRARLRVGGRAAGGAGGDARARVQRPGADERGLPSHARGGVRGGPGLGGARGSDGCHGRDGGGGRGGHGAAMNVPPAISLVVCTRDRAVHLRRRWPRTRTWRAGHRGSWCWSTTARATRRRGSWPSSRAGRRCR
jgi:ABC-type polysaccharide/polyol phosphate transport system ATPase subunit